MGYLVGRKGGKKGKGGKGKERRGLDSIFFSSFLFLLFLFFSNIHGRYITLHNITSHDNSGLLGHFQNGKERKGTEWKWGCFVHYTDLFENIILT